MITHDLGVVADIADDVMVMYAGRAAEKAPKREIFYHPHHPYTLGLLESIPSSSAAGGRLKPIPGQPPSLINLPAGCKFHPRCRYAFAKCKAGDDPVLRPVDDGGAHESACWLPAVSAGLSAEAEQLRTETAALGHEPAPADVPPAGRHHRAPDSGATQPGAAADNEGSVA
jgi:peptide/nickel transport system ATP-binding protein